MTVNLDRISINNTSSITPKETKVDGRKFIAIDGDSKEIMDQLARESRTCKIAKLKHHMYIVAALVVPLVTVAIFVVIMHAVPPVSIWILLGLSTVVAICAAAEIMLLIKQAFTVKMNDTKLQDLKFCITHMKDPAFKTFLKENFKQISQDKLLDISKCYDQKKELANRTKVFETDVLSLKDALKNSKAHKAELISLNALDQPEKLDQLLEKHKSDLKKNQLKANLLKVAFCVALIVGHIGIYSVYFVGLYALGISLMSGGAALAIIGGGICAFTIYRAYKKCKRLTEETEKIAELKSDWAKERLQAFINQHLDKRTAYTLQELLKIYELSCAKAALEYEKSQLQNLIENLKSD